MLTCPLLMSIPIVYFKTKTKTKTLTKTKTKTKAVHTPDRVSSGGQ